MENMGKVLVKNAVKRKAFIDPDWIDLEKIEEQRMAGRKKNAVGAVISKEGYIGLCESGDFRHQIFIEVKRGEINKKVLNSVAGEYKTIKITPKTNEAFIEIQKKNIHGRIVKIQSVYLVKNKKTIAKLSSDF